MVSWVVFLFFVGVALILAEFFVPGGICGAFGGIAIIASCALGWYHYPEHIFMIVMLEGIGIVICIIIGLYIMARTPVGRILVLQDSQQAAQGWVSNDDNHSLIGMVAPVHTALRPVGTIELNGERVQAVSAGAYIESGESVRVVEVHGNRIVVERADESA